VDSAKTSNEDIYQTLFSGLASLAGIIMAIIALLMNTVGTIAYGMPVAKYIMIFRPIKPLRYKWVVIEVIMLTALIWVAVAYRLNNLAVSLFITAVVLLIYLAVEVIRVMYSAQDIESEIRTYILESENFQHIVNLFMMIENSISSDDIFSFRRDTSLAKELLHLIPSKFPLKENTMVINDILFNITCAANRTQFSNSSDVLDLLITAVMVDNNTESNSVSVSTLDTFEAYRLFGKLSIRSLIGYEEHILFRWHKAF